jgi:sugar phosphate isomerase/epimerase
MLDIGIFAPYGTDHDRNISYCHDTDVRHILFSTGNFADKEGDGVPDPGPLKEAVARYSANGIILAGLTPPRVSMAAIQDASVRKEELDLLGRVIDGMGEAGIPYVHFYLNVDPLPSEADRPKLWESLTDIYRILGERAESAGVKISTHTYHKPDRLLWNGDTMADLIEGAASAHHGLTFCQGKSELAGDNLPDTIRRFGDRVFMVHLRDIVTKVEGHVDKKTQERLAQYGYLEVPFGEGECDMPGTIKALKDVGYTGQLYPEHYPSIAGDRAAGLAWTIGYIRALDQLVI